MRKHKPGKVFEFSVNALLAILIVTLYLVTGNPEAQQAMALSYGSPVYRGQGDGKIAIEFAVSWNAQALTGILDTLKENDTQVTFAVSGEWAKNNPELLKRMYEDGHELATMGFDPNKDGKLSWVTEDVRQSLEAIEAGSGATVRLYYSGSRNIAVSAGASETLHLTQVLSTTDLLCAKGTADDILTRALQNPIEGSIVLMQPTSEAAKALQRLIDAFLEKGIRLTPIKDVL
ncbi:MAG TPA: polysaccharide deacetylase family protein [Clostridia bacterium]|nr:polysaccharide deacetylase family protein [Clostridia bacterium]